jgi:hypothetical protein
MTVLLAVVISGVLFMIKFGNIAFQTVCLYKIRCLKSDCLVNFRCLVELGVFVAKFSNSNLKLRCYLLQMV